MDIPHADLPTSNGNQTYVLELNTTKRSEKGNSALHVTVTVNGVLVCSTTLLDDCSVLATDGAAAERGFAVRFRSLGPSWLQRVMDLARTCADIHG